MQAHLAVKLFVFVHGRVAVHCSSFDPRFDLVHLYSLHAVELRWIQFLLDLGFWLQFDRSLHQTLDDGLWWNESHHRRVVITKLAD